MKAILYVVGILLVGVMCLIGGYYWGNNSQEEDIEAIIAWLGTPNSNNTCRIVYQIDNQVHGMDVLCGSNCYREAQIGKPLPANGRPYKAGVVPDWLLEGAGIGK